MRGRDQIAGGEGAFACACCDNVPSGEKSAPSRQWVDTHSRSECVSTCAGHTFGYGSVSEEAWADAGTGVAGGIPYEVRPPARRRRRNSDFARNCCENACSGVEMTPERRSRSYLLRERALRRQNDAGGPLSAYLSLHSKRILAERVVRLVVVDLDGALDVHQLVKARDVIAGSSRPVRGPPSCRQPRTYRTGRRR